jgi:glycosyltransferase involved in cell wall biosynthesis
MTKPILSVLIDTYNHERYIEQALVSALEQDFPASDYEIVVVDDGSTDRTPEIVRKFAPRVRILSKKNGGQASAFNAAFPELKGEIIAILDGDDWFAPGKLNAVAKALERNPEAAAVGHGFYEFHEDTKEIKLRAPLQPKFLSLATPETAREAAAHWQFLIVGSLTVRRQVLEKIIPIPEALVFCADGPIAWASMAMGLYIFEEPLCYYRYHASNLHAVDAATQAKMRKRFEMGCLMLEQIEPILIRLGVSSDSLRAAFYPSWLEFSRSGLRTSGGSRLRAFQTEMRFFRMEHQNPTVGYLMFKYLAVGTATLLLPPRHFYQLRDWYGRQNLGRFRDRLFKTARHV